MADEIIHCEDCKYQIKSWIPDGRMKEKGYWAYNCAFIDDHFVGVPVWGRPDQFCSSAEKRKDDKEQG